MASLAFGLVFLAAAALLSIFSLELAQGCEDECHGGVVYVFIVGLLALIGLPLTLSGLVGMTRDRHRRQINRNERDLRALRRRIPPAER